MSAPSKKMKALVYYGPHDKRREERDIPSILQPTDAIVKIYKTTICGTDLHILRGSVPTVSPGRILGHEGIGFIEDVGTEIRKFQKGDFVLISCITSCGKCKNCAKSFYGHCLAGGWLLGNTIDGCQTEFVRIPHADTSLYALPNGDELKEIIGSARIDETERENKILRLIEPYVMLSDIMPTGLEVGVLEGKMEKGKSLCIVGAGPVGLAALLSAMDFDPSMVIVVDVDRNRLDVARKMGATHCIDNTNGRAVEAIMGLTGGMGVEVCIEAIGLPVGWNVCEGIVSAGGNIAILGVHGESVTLHLERMWKRNFTITAGLVHTSTIPSMIQRFQENQLNPKQLISHHFKLSEVMNAYECFGNAAKFGALKVIITNDLS